VRDITARVDDGVPGSGHERGEPVADARVAVAGQRDDAPAPRIRIAAPREQRDAVTARERGVDNMAP